MNWFVQKDISGNSRKFKEKISQEDSCCEHVEADPSVAVSDRTERDSFGIVSRYVCCAKCEEEAEERDEQVIHTCFDCGKKHAAKDGIAWKWYDFYAPQGDDPLHICNDCCAREKHINRVKRDREDYEAEMDRYEAEMYRYGN